MSSFQKTIIIASLLVSTVYNAVANDDTTWIRPDSFLIPVDTIYVDNLPCNYVADEITFPTVTPKSPEASAFQKYGETEINEYTGNPAISIPLYTLSYKGIEVSLSLTYDGGGIQVSQEASWVGLGWSLNVGGCINYVCQGGNDQWLGRYGSWKNDYYRILNSNPDLGLKNEQLYLANYYDDHNFLNGQLAKQSTSQNLSATSSSSKKSYSKGALTGTISRDTDGKFLVAAIYHNQEGLVVETRQSMPDDALLCQRTTYSFTKKPLTIETQVKKEGIEKTITQKNQYNQYNDKIESITLNAGKGDKEVAFYSYDDIGRLVSVKRSGNAGTVTNEYNIRNWLVSTSSDRFKESLKYESGSETPCYNGNISRMQWLNTYDNVLRGYDFEYDGLNRLTASAYAEGTDMSQNKDRYSEYIPQYSPNGSIERLQRYGKKNNGAFGIIDDLTYQYRGNQIQSISDKAGSLLYDGSFDFKDGTSESTEYFYNANGALTKDLNKGISKIKYDVLDNLSCITFNNGFKTKYVYDAGGSKLRTIHEALTTNTTDYIGDFIFEDGKLSKYQFEGGYCSFDSNLNPTYHYYEKDHLGSIRMVVNENGTIEQVNHYYPFGGVYGDLAYNSELQKNKYIGKEFDHTSGLDWYDHGARMYDAAKGSWDRVDFLCEKNTSSSIYGYCHNNPILFVDPDGNDDYFSNNGNYLYSKNNTANIYVFQGKTPVKFNKFDLRNTNNMKVGARVIGHYARLAGIKYNMNGGEGHVGISTLHTTDTEEGVLAQTLGKDIFIKMTNGKLNEEMYNSNNLVSTLEHEKEHQESNERLTFFIHSNIVLKQIQADSFNKCSENFQVGTVGNLIDLMNKANNSNSNSTNSLIQLMNKANDAIKPLHIGKIIRRNNHFEYEYD